MIIRSAEPRDAAGWQKLREQLWANADSKRDIEAYFATSVDETARVLIAEHETEGVIGFAEISVRRDYVEGSSCSPVAYLEGWFVGEAWRRQGVGKALIAAAENWARETGHVEFASDTTLDNTASIATHLACGFTEAERTVHFIKRL